MNASLVVAEAALLGPPLGDGGQLVVPDQLAHVGGGRLGACRAPRLLPQRHLRTQLVVEVEGRRLLGLGQTADGEVAVAGGPDALKCVWRCRNYYRKGY